MLGRDQMIKLIDFGSSDSTVYETADLTTKERNILEDKLMRFTTPMYNSIRLSSLVFEVLFWRFCLHCRYRPPEILDLWSGLKIDQHVDLWALGCILYYLTHSEHPFSDSNKLATINCKYSKKPSAFVRIIGKVLEVVLTELAGILLWVFIGHRGSLGCQSWRKMDIRRSTARTEGDGNRRHS